jgi:hypothetical protein
VREVEPVLVEHVAQSVIAEIGNALTLPEPVAPQKTLKTGFGNLMTKVVRDEIGKQIEKPKSKETNLHSFVHGAIASSVTELTTNGKILTQTRKDLVEAKTEIKALETQVTMWKNASDEKDKLIKAMQNVNEIREKDAREAKLNSAHASFNDATPTEPPSKKQRKEKKKKKKDVSFQDEGADKSAEPEATTDAGIEQKEKTPELEPAKPETIDEPMPDAVDMRTESSSDDGSPSPVAT